MSPEGNTSHLLILAAEGEAWAREQAARELLTRTSRPLGQLARSLVDRCPAAQRWLEPEDLLQESQIRLLEALRSGPFQSSRHFWNTAVQQLRFALIDLARQHTDQHGDGDAAVDPGGLDEWDCFHEALAGLSEDHQALFDLLYYQGMTQEEAAQLLELPLRTLKLHWQQARGELGRRLRQR
jgi:RNA polymerase sigma-70 factor (ECF subfamily)